MRVALQGRRVRAWVVATDVETPVGVALKPIAQMSRGYIAPEVIELARWAAWRWAGRLVHLLDTATSASARVTRGEPAPAGVRVLRVAPASPLPRFDNALVVDGRRSAIWASVDRYDAIVVVDEHDEGLKEERVPTWHARDVAVERARRAGVPCVLVSPTPSLEALASGQLLTPSRSDERAGWPVVEVVDRRREPPGLGLFSPRLATVVREAERVVCVLNRKGRARLLACNACAELARCEVCGAAVEQPSDASVLRCRRCRTERAVVCAACGSTRLRSLRIGVSRARDELARLANRPVAEVTADSDAGVDAPVIVGTEAVLHRVDGADVVAFLDLDQELLAPRYRAAEEAMALLVRAARLVGGRDGGGRLLLQTRLPAHETVDAAVHADPSRLALVESARRAALRFPPETALAMVSGEAADAFVAGLDGVEVLGPHAGRWLVRAPDHTALCHALARVPRPPGRLRVAVDPLRA